MNVNQTFCFLFVIGFTTTMVTIYLTIGISIAMWHHFKKRGGSK